MGKGCLAGYNEHDLRRGRGFKKFSGARAEKGYPQQGGRMGQDTGASPRDTCAEALHGGDYEVHVVRSACCSGTSPLEGTKEGLERCCSNRGPRFNSLHLCGGSQSSLSLVPRALMICYVACASGTHTHTNLNFKKEGTKEAVHRHMLHTALCG